MNAITEGQHPTVDTLIDDCVHCGFCLPSCPTYALWGEEMDSPRGRIYLMKELRDGEPLGDNIVRHMDRCLGCMACVTACPSGVQYDRLIESTRSRIEREHQRSTADRLFRALIFALFPYPRRLRLASRPLRLYQRTGLQRLIRNSGLLNRLPARLSAMESLLPALPGYVPTPPVLLRAHGTERRRVGLLLGCVQGVFFPQVNAATARVLAAEGCTVVAPRVQGCCGALSLHTGREEEARQFARRTIDTFEAAAVETVVVNAAGCGSSLKEYGYLLRDDPAYAARAATFSARVRDISELLDELGPVATRHPLPLTAVYHDACHLAHAQGVRRQPRALLNAIPGLTLREVARERDLCCGSAGIYNMVEPQPARELGERKARHILESGGDLLVTANPGCALQIRASLERMGTTLPTAHPIELLDLSLRGQPLSALIQG